MELLIRQLRILSKLSYLLLLCKKKFKAGVKMQIRGLNYKYHQNLSHLSADPFRPSSCSIRSLLV
jgi:hypothetical protein